MQRANSSGRNPGKGGRNVTRRSVAGAVAIVRPTAARDLFRAMEERGKVRRPRDRGESDVTLKLTWSPFIYNMRPGRSFPVQPAINFFFVKKFT